MLHQKRGIASEPNQTATHVKQGEGPKLVESSSEPTADAQERTSLEEELEEILASIRASGRAMSLAENTRVRDALLGFDKERRITKEVRQRARWIVEWAIQKTRLAENESLGSPSVHDGEHLRDLLFTYPPYVFSYLRLSDQLSLLARGSRVEALQGSLMQPCLGEMVYGLSFAQDPEQILDQAWSGASLTDKLDFIDFIPTLFAYMNAQGELADLGSKAVRHFLQTRERTESSFFLTTLLSEARQRIEDERELPTAGVGIRSGDRRVGRMRFDQGDQREEDAQLKRKISLEHGAAYLLRRVSSDAIAAFDHASIPQGYLMLSERAVTDLPELGIDTANLEKVEALLARPLRSQAKSWCLMTIQNSFLSASERTGEAWEARLPVLSAEQWDSYWKLEGEQEALVKEARALQAIPEPSKTERARLKHLLWRSGLVDEELQPATDRINRDPQLREVMRALAKGIPRPDPMKMIPFEHFEDNRLLMPKGEKEQIEAAVLLQVLHRPSVRAKLESRMNLSLNQLSLREQIQLLSFLVQSDAKKQADAFHYIQTYGLVGARSFLSCEYDPKMGDALLKLSQERPAEAVQKVLEQYSALVECAAASSESLHEKFFSEDKEVPISKKPLKMRCSRGQNHSLQKQRRSRMSHSTACFEATQKIYRFL